MSEYVGNGKTGTANQRKARRAEIHRHHMAKAERDAYQVNRSMKCGTFGNHAPGGCQNDGSTCICECHDPVQDCTEEKS